MSLNVPGKPAEFEELFRLHYRFLCNVANKILHDRDASEDVVQDVFAKLWTKKTEIPFLQSGKNYLFRVTVNATLDYLEKNKKVVRLNDETAHISFTNETEETLDVKELEMKISKTLEELPPKCKAVFILSRYEGMKYKEIAEHLDISVKTVENHMGKALAHMREKLISHMGHNNIPLRMILLAVIIGCLRLWSFKWLLLMAI
jgi:RNA polymerase sigma-70 factor (ECF subfamily)